MSECLGNIFRISIPALATSVSGITVFDAGRIDNCAFVTMSERLYIFGIIISATLTEVKF